MAPSIDKLATIVREVTTKSAMNPMLWLTGFSFLALVALSIARVDPIVIYVVLGITTICGLTGVGGFLYFMLTNPNRLQDERHLERMFAMQQQANQGKPVSIEADAPTHNPRVIEGRSMDRSAASHGERPAIEAGTNNTLGPNDVDGNQA